MTEISGYRGYALCTSSTDHPGQPAGPTALLGTSLTQAHRNVQDSDSGGADAARAVRAEEAGDPGLLGQELGLQDAQAEPGCMGDQVAHQARAQALALPGVLDEDPEFRRALVDEAAACQGDDLGRPCFLVGSHVAGTLVGIG